MEPQICIFNIHWVVWMLLVWRPHSEALTQLTRIRRGSAYLVSGMYSQLCNQPAGHLGNPPLCASDYRFVNGEKVNLILRESVKINKGPYNRTGSFLGPGGYCLESGLLPGVMVPELLLPRQVMAPSSQPIHGPILTWDVFDVVALRRLLIMGQWKGSGFSRLIDLALNHGSGHVVSPGQVT